nr:hypothetical protein [uncultured Dyadobacter sp.]
MNALKNNNPNDKQASINQQEILKSFFQTDGVGEIVSSLNVMAESFLFGQNLENVSAEMRGHLVNQLRVASLIAQLGENYR